MTTRRSVLAGASALVFAALAKPASAASLTISTPMAPPEWALLQRELLKANEQACAAFFARYFDERGWLFCGCYEPSRVLRISPDGRTVEIYVEDPTAHLLAHPTNIAFDGTALYTANLGRWHVTRVDTDTSARPLWRVVAEAMSKQAITAPRGGRA